MMTTNNRKNSLSWKEQKRQIKLARKEQKMARKEAKQANKLLRRQQRVVVGSKAYLQREQAIQFLEEILAGLKSGVVNVEQGEQKVTLHPQDTIRVSIRARQKLATEGVRISLRWPRTKADNSGPDVKVSAE